MSAVIDYLLVCIAIIASAWYAFAHLAPRSLRLQVLRAGAAMAHTIPASMGGGWLRARADRAVERLSAQSGCGGCGSCASDAPPAQEQRIDVGAITRRKS